MKLFLKIFFLPKTLELIFILLLFCSSLLAQPDSILIEYISTGEGLSHKNVHCIMEDSYGFLWVGTNDGLNRYDGYEFIVYRNNVWNTKSLSSPIIKQLVEDIEGNIWVGTSNGLNYYQRKSDSFIRYTHNPKNKYSISDNDNIESLFIDKTNPNYLWIGTDGGGLNLLDINMQRFYVFKNDSNNINTLSGNKIYSLFQDSFKDFWIGTSDAGLNKINLDSIPKTNSGGYDISKFSSLKFKRFIRNQDNSNRFNPRWVYSFYEDKSNRLWILGDSDVLTYDRGKNELIPFPYSYYDINHYHEMIEDKKGNFWFGEHNRVYLLQFGKNILYEYRLNKEQIRSDSNQGLCEDNSGSIWVATWDGIVRIYINKQLFEHHYHNVYDQNVPAGDHMYTILSDRSGRVWIGTYSGLILQGSERDGLNKFINYSDLHNLDIGSVWSIVQDPHGSIWIVADYTLLRIDPKINSVVKYRNSQDNNNCLSLQNKLGWQGATNLLIDNEKNLWIAAFRGGISKFKLEDLYSANDLSKVTAINYFSGQDDPANTVENFIQDSYGNIWICSQNGGIYMIDPDTEIIKNYKYESGNPQSLSHNYVNSVREDESGNLWFGTYGGGLNKFERTTESFKNFSIKDGLPSDIIQGILTDGNDNLWIATNSGITKFNPENKKVRNYDVQENRVSYLDTLTGKMYFGNENGFVVFHPDSIKESTYVPGVVITKFIRFSDDNDGEQIIDRTISAKDNIELSYKDDIISFEFAAMSFDKNIKCEYAYKLEGFNNNWISIGTKREVTFTNLDPGDYNFKVKACNEDGIWCTNYASIHLSISPPWWSTTWAYGAYIIFILSVLYGVRKYELNRRHEKEEKRVLWLENNRKSRELEQARKLQLSMLPKEVPLLPDLDISVYIKTATEVGGDYYDFHHSKQNGLTVLLGDATGHGINAGMLVSITKGLFQNLAPQDNLKNIISQFNSSLLSMKLQPMYMSLTLLRIINNEFQVIGAGMPPSLYYQNNTGIVTEIESSGPTLGGFSDFSYDVYNYYLSSGDVIVLMSDGFAERRNKRKEIYGWDRGKELLSEIVNLNSQQIINELVKASEEWGGERPQDDDITFVAIKVK